MLQEIILAGFGGQGVMSMGQLLAYAGMEENKQVSWIPSYGPEMRGGTANCSVTLSDTPVSSPLIDEPDTLFVLNRPSLEKFEGNVKPGGLLLLNSSLVKVEPQRTDLRVLKLPVDNLAQEKFGNSRVANMILVGAFVAITGAVSLDSVVGALKKVLPEHRHKLIPLNRQALELGVELAQS
ncbi:acceptor oxidoreductase, gamma subunit, pyruvate/2-ketoisovalerate [Acididesulfobacillus acetoxydans]|uniref:2-oxoglutarate oxidoreductase n=1 Tax=Acididesulfobacillus acetoxydans TaxID=1561005 RepID=A0A8S0XC69_9FIRM|nr:2-oxoacid:acceptor oxidoreductase family protein [Acididesulfobacillus acetoxydans]CAA7602096.1 acceptor oxidoreductase, gamma subunit, pyruvate/2-ketoisovalerate [Acididesulfobacillus acetoxydans]CEJ08061.1 2-oxoglutarate oxidoreductase [Acididesulfobacillus acetoxydans]